MVAGRDATCQLSDPDETLSRQHAEITVEDGRVYVRDLGTANGTWVDGQRLPQGAALIPIRPGQQVLLGHAALSVVWERAGERVGATNATSARTVFAAPAMTLAPSVVAPVAAPQGRPGSGMGVAALVLGIVGLVGSFVPCLGIYALPLTVLAIIFGLAGRHHGTGIAGLVCGLIGTCIGSYWIYVVVEAREIVQKAGDDLQRIRDEAAERQNERDRAELRRRPVLSGPACTVAGLRGVCIDVGSCPGVATSGLCEGAANIQCCVY